MANDKYEAEQAIVVGPNARVKAKSVSFFKFQGTSELDAAKLAQELATLRAAVRQYDGHDVTDDDKDETAGALLEAQRAAEKGDEAEARSALARTGKWVLKVAESIGVGVATAALRQVLLGA